MNGDVIPVDLEMKLRKNLLALHCLPKECLFTMKKGIKQWKLE